MQNTAATPEAYGEGQETYPMFEIVSNNFQELVRPYPAWPSSSLFANMDYSAAGMH